MRQHPDPDPYDEDEEDLEELGTPVYQGRGLSVRALTAEELQRFLDAHQGQPAQLLGSGWAALDPPGDPLGGPRTPPAATLPVVPAEPPAGSLGSPGRSALVEYRRRRALELTGWTRSLAWRAPLVAAPSGVHEAAVRIGGVGGRLGVGCLVTAPRLDMRAGLLALGPGRGRQLGDPPLIPALPRGGLGLQEGLGLPQPRQPAGLGG
jgi:hypothetical protein